MIGDILGWVGAFCILLAYFLVSSKRVKSDSRLFQSINLTGALFLIVNAYANGALPFVFLNVIWAAIAIRALVKNK